MDVLLGYAALDNAVAEVRLAAGDLEGARREAASLIDRLLDGGWSGAAAESFGAAWEEWLAGEEQVRSALASIEAALVATGDQLSTADHDTGARLARMIGRLGG